MEIDFLLDDVVTFTVLTRDYHEVRWVSHEPGYRTVLDDFPEISETMMQEKLIQK